LPLRRSLALRPIKTDKHEITWSNLLQNASTAVSVRTLIGVQSAAKDAADEVETGSHVKSMYFEFNVAAEAVTVPRVIHWTVHIRPQNLSAAGNTPSVYYANGRNLILKRGMEMLPKDVSTVYKRVFVVRIPKKYQRVGEGDTMNFSYISSDAATINMCEFCIYKEYY